MEELDRGEHDLAQLAGTARTSEDNRVEQRARTGAGAGETAAGGAEAGGTGGTAAEARSVKEHMRMRMEESAEHCRRNRLRKLES